MMCNWQSKTFENTSLKKNPRKIFRELTQAIRVSNSTIPDNLVKIDKGNNFDKWDPYECYKCWTFGSMLELNLRNLNDPFLFRIVSV